MTSDVGVHVARQTTDELVVLDILLLDKRLDPFVEVSRVPVIITVVLVHVFREMADRSVSLWKWIVVVMRAGRCTRARRVDGGSPLPRGDRGVRRTVIRLLGR